MTEITIDANLLKRLRDAAMDKYVESRRAGNDYLSAKWKADVQTVDLLLRVKADESEAVGEQP